jgi:hypothetical protein
VPIPANSLGTKGHLIRNTVSLVSFVCHGSEPLASGGILHVAQAATL